MWFKIKINKLLGKNDGNNNRAKYIICIRKFKTHLFTICNITAFKKERRILGNKT